MLLASTLSLIVAVLVAWTIRLQRELAHTKRNRESERKGRIKAEVALRTALDVRVQHEQQSIEFRQIGYIESCYQQRNGTPRQAMLVPDSRARLVLHGDIPHASYEDLKGFSHVWIIYAFHKNTNLHQRLRGKGFKAKIRVPRLNGRRVSVFATRSPHRFNNIGLSIGKILQVENGCIHLAGVDVIDGTPVLDIKPYISTYDAMLDAQSPEWLPLEKEICDEPFRIEQVSISCALRERMCDIWKETYNEQQTRFNTFEEFCGCVEGSLYRDMRSAHHRLNHNSYGAQDTVYRVAVDRVAIFYVIDSQKRVTVTDVHSCDVDS